MKATELLEWVSKVKSKPKSAKDEPSGLSQDDWPDYLYLSPAGSGETVCDTEDEMREILKIINRDLDSEDHYRFSDCNRIDFVERIGTHSAYYKRSFSLNWHGQKAEIVRWHWAFKIKRWVD